MSEEWTICPVCNGGHGTHDTTYPFHCARCHNSYDMDAGSITVINTVGMDGVCSACRMEVQPPMTMGACPICGGEREVIRETEYVIQSACTNPECPGRHRVPVSGRAMLMLDDLTEMQIARARDRMSPQFFFAGNGPQSFGEMVTPGFVEIDFEEPNVLARAARSFFDNDPVIGRALQDIPQGSISTVSLDLGSRTWQEFYAEYEQESLENPGLQFHVDGPVRIPPHIPAPNKERRCYCCDSVINFHHHVGECTRRMDMNEEKNQDKIYGMWSNEDVELLCCQCMRDANGYGVQYIIDKKEVRERLLRALREMKGMVFDHEHTPRWVAMEIRNELRRMGYHG